jgi:uncharacterized protein YebE (UPF0316 family)
MIVLISFLIFFSRVLDVTIGTIRIIFISRGKKFVPVFLGFLEALLWIFVISQVIQNLDHIVYYFAYAAGFSVGNFMGIILAEKFSENFLLIRIISAEKTKELIDGLRQCQVGITELQGQGIENKVSVIFTIIDKKCEKRVKKVIHAINPNAFYTIESVGVVNKGYLPFRKNYLTSNYSFLLNRRKKYS